MDFLVIIFAAVCCGFIIGLCICFTGVGGGALIIPVIAFFFDQPPSVAVGSAGLYATLTKIMAAADNAKRRNIDYRLFARIAIFAAPGTLLAAALVNSYLAMRPDGEAMLQSFLRGAVVAAILLSLLAARLRASAVANRQGLSIGAFVIGAVMGLTGVGGGVLIAPLMLAFGGIPPKRIVGTSLLTALALSCLTALVYAGGGQINYPLALAMSAGALFATPLGGAMLRRATEETVRRTMFALIFLAAALMAADGFAQPASP